LKLLLSEILHAENNFEQNRGRLRPSYLSVLGLALTN